jgi:hypothetical protein
MQRLFVIAQELQEIPLESVNFETHAPHTLIPFPLDDSRLDTLLEKIIYLQPEKAFPRKSSATNLVFRMARYADDWGGEEWTEKLLHMVVTKMSVRLKVCSVCFVDPYLSDD